MSLESIHLLLNVYNDKDKVNVKGSGLRKTFKGGADMDIESMLKLQKELNRDITSHNEFMEKFKQDKINYDFF